MILYNILSGRQGLLVIMSLMEEIVNACERIEYGTTVFLNILYVILAVLLFICLISFSRDGDRLARIEEIRILDCRKRNLRGSNHAIPESRRTR